MLNAVARALSDAIDGVVEDVAIAPLIGGACQELFKIDARVNGEMKRFVLRSDAKSSLPGSLDRRAEHDVIVKARCAGVRTPNAFGLTRGLLRDDAFAYFMDWIDGETIGAKVLRAPDLAAAREKLPDELATELAKIHSVGGAPGARDPASIAVAAQREALDGIAEPRPALERALSWLEANRPPPGEVALVHGDFRVGNFVVGTDGLRAVLDWEFAHDGDPLEDLAWLCMRDWRFGQLKLAAGGLCSRAAFYSMYERASGRRVDPARVLWWEIMSNVRWGLGAFVQGLRYLGGHQSDLELIAIGRRTQEMEYEALRLIDHAGPAR